MRLSKLLQPQLSLTFNVLILLAISLQKVKIECPCDIEIVRRPISFILYYYIVLNVSISYELLNNFPNGCKMYYVVGVNQLNTLLALSVIFSYVLFVFTWVNIYFLRHLYVREKIYLIYRHLTLHVRLFIVDLICSCAVLCLCAICYQKFVFSLTKFLTYRCHFIEIYLIR